MVETNTISPFRYLKRTDLESTLLATTRIFGLSSTETQGPKGNEEGAFRKP